MALCSLLCFLGARVTLLQIYKALGFESKINLWVVVLLIFIVAVIYLVAYWANEND